MLVNTPAAQGAIGDVYNVRNIAHSFLAWDFADPRLSFRLPHPTALIPDPQ